MAEGLDPTQNPDQTDSDLLEGGFATGNEGEGYEDSAGGTDD